MYFRNYGGRLREIRKNADIFLFVRSWHNLAGICKLLVLYELLQA